MTQGDGVKTTTKKFQNSFLDTFGVSKKAKEK